MSATTAIPAKTIEPLRILLVDDDPEARRLLAKSFERRGHRVTCAEEVEEAGAILEFRDYHVLCLDLDLAGLNGLEGLDLVADARLRRPQLRIVVESGNGDPRVHDACRARGAVGVFVKGQPLTQLHELVEGV
ncbi:MAG: response regulator [Thermoanaerobaculia bacterium]|nr:response regulator [Thermoanaerobaculia bacterium]